ncbi:bifunctional diaminohydroxyphosphoribosylaminopyrimidine deaminase/5-amino-6-(5-phosphoribosylamino)uracil reductase RibD [Ancylobacter sp. 6x-1]|uniref:Riboflavin biosynthesis protein RibD n=2 Tax=Ancylobacter crimeensis TaxID=2579147 RepID=A0ABT0D6Z3_9HYPH|nr:bifunctional diaminohydroxyphosphoribosylaminopyrimidine deaminase/5-amino-6-(5-phosphoribosylamino)uracil reductase RibD [Ancylobacter crimeensis]MCK0195697.1 bifunctional diaminohydroxyphosphoribosylaminopyrimidine deaminase/5-amino-6-(5-phosphoribosylamino)uracil reductase RibD [Ancylobacter crimeensis]
MGSALAIGRRNLGRAWPNPSVGALVVRQEPDGPVVLGRGCTAMGGRPHAEPQAIQQAGEGARGATLYVTLEPCSHHGRTPPCTDAIRAAGIARVVAAIEDPDPRVAGRGFALLEASGIEVTVGPGAADARIDHAGHIMRVRQGRPHILLKMAVSTDSKAGLAGRRPVRITGEAAQAQVHLMRAQADAVLTGIGTVLADDPQLTCRLPGMLDRSPVRVVLDRTLRLPHSAALVRTLDIAPVWVIAGIDASADAEIALRERGVEVMRVSEDASGALDLPEAARLLAMRGITRLMVEAGPRIAASFIRADLVDEAAIFQGPGTLGPDAVDAWEGVSSDILAQTLSITDTRMLGPDRLGIMRR